MRGSALVVVLLAGGIASSADVESRVLTHYVPQDLLETVVRKEGWTELTLNVKGGVRKGDVVRVWAGGSIDRGGDQPGENVNSPHGTTSEPGATFALSSQPTDCYALLLKIESGQPTKCKSPGKPLEIKLTKDGEKVSIGFNDEKGRFHDNRLGKGKRHELDPLWVRIEVVRIVVD